MITYVVAYLYICLQGRSGMYFWWNYAFLVHMALYYTRKLSPQIVLYLHMPKINYSDSGSLNQQWLLSLLNQIILCPCWQRSPHSTLALLWYLLPFRPTVAEYGGHGLKPRNGKSRQTRIASLRHSVMAAESDPRSLWTWPFDPEAQQWGCWDSPKVTV